MIRDCMVVAIEGTHASGKTTLVHALTAHYLRAGINTVAMHEPARTSPYMHDIVIGGRGEFDLAAEVDVFAAHLSDQLRLARNYQLLIADKTVINAATYARLVLTVEPGSIDAGVLDAMDGFARAWAHTYDHIVLTGDHYTDPGDPFRAKINGLQHTAATALRETYARLGVAVHDLPTGLSTTERIDWITDHLPVDQVRVR